MEESLHWATFQNSLSNIYSELQTKTEFAAENKQIRRKEPFSDVIWI